MAKFKTKGDEGSLTIRDFLSKLGLPAEHAHSQKEFEEWAKRKKIQFYSIGGAMHIMSIYPDETVADLLVIDLEEL